MVARYAFLCWVFLNALLFVGVAWLFRLLVSYIIPTSREARPGIFLGKWLIAIAFSLSVSIARS